MKEFDFDELDRAVNTLMGNVPKATEPAKQDDVKTLTITPTLTDDKMPQLPVDVTEPVALASSADPVTSAVPSESREQFRSVAPAARRSGRFMDVIHPSASTQRKASSTLGVSRQGVTLEPLASPAEETVAHVVPTEEIVPVTHDSQESDIVADVAEVRDWPDPLEFNNASSASDDEVDQEQALDEALAKTEQIEPLSSPFLADAKVEKRPLGGPVPELMLEAHTLDTTEQEEVSESRDDVQAPADAVVLPEELQGDLMAIESDTTAGNVTSESVTPEAATQPVKAVVAEKSFVTPTAAPIAAAVSAASSTGAVSIPQQYREAPSTGDQTTGSIYDTDTYHQPLEHPAKKRTGWLWVVWVLVLLLLGAGGGALAYLYLLQ